MIASWRAFKTVVLGVEGKGSGAGGREEGCKSCCWALGHCWAFGDMAGQFWS